MKKSVPDLSVIVHLTILKRDEAEIRIQHYNISKKCKENYDETIGCELAAALLQLQKEKDNAAGRVARSSCCYE
jgi:hypothetical protein